MWVAIMDASERWLACGETEQEAMARITEAWNASVGREWNPPRGDIHEYFGTWTYNIDSSTAVFRDDRRVDSTLGSPS